MSRGVKPNTQEWMQNTPPELREQYEVFDPNEDLFLHALGTMHTPRYREENAGALVSDWPRIPLPATAELLTHSATLGRRLAELLDPESDIQLQAEWSFLAKLSIAAEFPEGTPDRGQRNAARLALTAGWGGAGQGATVMPRRGKAPERDWTPTELDRLTALAATQQLTLDDALALLGARCVVCLPERRRPLGGRPLQRLALHPRRLSSPQKVAKLSRTPSARSPPPRRRSPLLRPGRPPHRRHPPHGPGTRRKLCSHHPHGNWTAKRQLSQMVISLRLSDVSTQQRIRVFTQLRGRNTFGHPQQKP